MTQSVFPVIFRGLSDGTEQAEGWTFLFFFFFFKLFK